MKIIHQTIPSKKIMNVYTFDSKFVGTYTAESDVTIADENLQIIIPKGMTDLSLLPKLIPAVKYLVIIFEDSTSIYDLLALKPLESKLVYLKFDSKDSGFLRFINHIKLWNVKKHEIVKHGQIIDAKSKTYDSQLIRNKQYLHISDIIVNGPIISYHISSKLFEAVESIIQTGTLNEVIIQKINDIYQIIYDDEEYHEISIKLITEAQLTEVINWNNDYEEDDDVHYKDTAKIRQIPLKPQDLWVVDPKSI
jgi:hypothetical protein